jgi:class 3 adenylate cyclase/tetratricopeptide (TPR) repeat protein
VEAERRQVTVLFTDMVGFTAFAEQAGEEAAFTLMRNLAKVMDEAVREQGGVVQSFTGDGIMAVFGALAAFEDAPLRACRAALSILERVRVVGGDLEATYSIRPQLRIGLNSGAAVVGIVESGPNAGVTVLGDTVNVAARLQAQAAPDTVRMSEATHRAVQGMVDASFCGEHQLRGKSQPQKVYKLDAIRHGAARFDAAISRGLGAFVGRERELGILERGFAKAEVQLQVFDIMAEPGMGKSRLLYEFRQRIGKERAYFLSGSCSLDGQQTPFLPFIEVVRGSFRVSAGESEPSIAQKLQLGLTTLDLHSARNHGLLLHLLGLPAPDDSLTGLDGVLLGLRTRELLQQMLEARCRLSPVVMVVEDLHWIDSASEQVLSKIIASNVTLRLLLLTSRRPEYTPPWLDHPVVIQTPLGPLGTEEVRRLVQARLEIDSLPEALAQQVVEKADGNPLFAEEIAAVLIERGLLRTKDATNFEKEAVAVSLPSTIQNLLMARVDRLPPQDRALLQAAAAIGRQFDPQLLAVVSGATDIDTRLAAMRSLDLIHPEDKSSDYIFKHALVRDALYHSLLTEPREALHANIAAEIERRSGNRLIEVAEVLAYHYGHTRLVDKAFAFHCAAGNKSLGIYSLEEAMIHFGAALTRLESSPRCASDEQVADFLAALALLLSIRHSVAETIDVIERYLPRVSRLGDHSRVVLIYHHYAYALFFGARYRHAAVAVREALHMAERLGDEASIAYMLASEIFVSIVVDPKPAHQFERLKAQAIEMTLRTTDPYLKAWTRFAIGWNEMHRGRMNHARAMARELLEAGARMNDPRSTGFGFWILAWVSLVADSYSEALEYSEQALAVAVAPVDRASAIGAKGCALLLLRRVEEGRKLIEEWHRGVLADGDLYVASIARGFEGLCKVLQGRLAEGIRCIEEAISTLDKDGQKSAADWTRMQLSEVYIEVIVGNERPPVKVILRNLSILLRIAITGSRRIESLVAPILQNPAFDPMGHMVARAHMILGLLYKAKKKRPLAVQHLTKAREITSQFGATPMLARIDSAVAELTK